MSFGDYNIRPQSKNPRLDITLNLQQLFLINDFFMFWWRPGRIARTEGRQEKSVTQNSENYQWAGKRHTDVSGVRSSSCVASLPFYLIVTCVSLSPLEPLVLFSSFFPSPSFAESCGTYLPLEDRFYLVGSICIFRTQTLQVSMLCVFLPNCGIVGFL